MLSVCLRSWLNKLRQWFHGSAAAPAVPNTPRATPPQAFFAHNLDRYVTYRPFGRYAIVMEGAILSDPVGELGLLQAFEQHCRRKRLKPIYFGIDATAVSLYEVMGKQVLTIGQRGYTALSDALLTREPTGEPAAGLPKHVQVQHHTPPLSDALMAQLRAVSADWQPRLQPAGRLRFRPVGALESVRYQSVITLARPDGTVLAFANITDTGRCDFLRKRQDVSSDLLDLLLVELMRHYRQQGFQQMQLGLAPFAQLPAAQTFAERARALGYQWLQNDPNARELRLLKERHADGWQPVYMAYSTDQDLIQTLLFLQQWPSLVHASHSQNEPA